MDEDIRAEITNEVWATQGCMQRCNTGSKDFAWWEGYRAGLLWVLHLIDKPDIDEDPVLTEEELHIEQKTKS